MAACLLLSPVALTAQSPTNPGGTALRACAVAPQLTHVLHDAPGDGHLHAATPRYKASFGADGCRYVPFFGSAAARTFPVHMQLRRVTVAGAPLPLRAEPTVTRRGDRITIDHGPAQVHYDLRLDHTEQTFVVDTKVPGDVDVELAVVSELREDPHTPGLQFGNELGRVDYGSAWLVDGERRVAIETRWTGDAIAMRVPAAARGDGPVVVDPIVSTHAVSGPQGPTVRRPDIAYDAGTDRYLVLWEIEWAFGDNDVYAEARQGDGSPVANGIVPIDISLLSTTVPRAANAASSGRFLVAFQQTPLGGFSAILARTIAASTLQATAPAQLSDSFYGNHRTPDVGGSPGAGPSDGAFCVAWTRYHNLGDADIAVRVLDANGTPLQSTSTVVAGEQYAYYHNVQVSESNGFGRMADPCWMLVYSRRYSPTDFDVYGTTLRGNSSVVQANTVVDYASANDLLPHVTAPLVDHPNGPGFFVTYERQSPSSAMGRLLSPQLANMTYPTDLTASLGVPPFWVQAESDGTRIALLTGGAGLAVGTVALVGNTFTLQETPQPLVGTASWPRLVAKRSTGGPRTAYAITYIDEAPAVDQVMFARYEGRSPNGGTATRTTGCGPLQLTVGGTSAIGHVLQFTLGGTSQPTGFLFGLPAPATPLCANCTLGLAANGPIVPTFPATTMGVTIPPVPALVGATFAVQGLAVSNGGCLGLLQLSQTIDFTIG